jgi:hypothetical protein
MVTVPAATPSRWNALFPGTDVALHPWPRSAAPRIAIELRLRDGDARTREAFKAALRGASRRLPLTDLHLHYGGLLARTVADGDVDWIKSWMASEADAKVLKVLSTQLGTHDHTAGSGATEPGGSRGGPSREELASFAKAVLGDPRDEFRALEIRDALVGMEPHDRQRAVAAARAIDLRGTAHPFLVPVIRALVDFPTREEFAVWLRDQGLIERPGRRRRLAWRQLSATESGG